MVRADLHDSMRHQVGHLDAWRDPQISLSDYNNARAVKA
jgi:hypothetical protein